ncbi:unnamed protein product [Coregonus sp. 'balchen']|nr:unnamed protein product [Coregonus sp. 'balchen']
MAGGAWPGELRGMCQQEDRSALRWGPADSRIECLKLGCQPGGVGATGSLMPQFNQEKRKQGMEKTNGQAATGRHLDRTCDGETPDLGDLEESERETVQAILDVVDQCVGEDEIRSSLLTAIHLIVSAMDGEIESSFHRILCYYLISYWETRFTTVVLYVCIFISTGMTDEGLSVLGSCCSPPVLQALQILVQHVAAGSGETLSLRDAGLAVLTEEEVFGRTESLFGHSKVTLKREEVTLRTEMKDQPGYLPLVMSITVKGLAFLVQAERE